MPQTNRRDFMKEVIAATGTCLIARSVPAATSKPHEATPPTPPLTDSMRRVSKCCVAWLNPDEKFRPTGGYEIAHDTGRWWDAMLRYEAATGDRIPEEIEKSMLANLHEMSDNPAALLMNMFLPPESRVVNLHNIRESMQTFTLLHKYRQNDWARTQGQKLVAAFDRLLDPDGQIDYERLQAFMEGRKINDDPMMCPKAPPGEWFDSSGTTGRAIEPILSFAEITKNDQAMELAKRLAEAHLRMLTDPSGAVRSELLRAEHVGHNHSYCGTLRGLLLFGMATREPSYVDAVAKTYRNGLWGTTISHSGWTPHDLGKLRFPNEDGDPVGEHGSCADVMLLALWLGLHANQPELLDDVERLIRARLLPSQIVDPGNPRNDGAWGVYGHPFDFGSILDVFAAVLHALVEVNAQIVTRLPDGTCSVNLNITCDAPLASVVVSRDETAAIGVTPKQQAPLRIRVPQWVPRESLKISLGDRTPTPRLEGSWLYLDAADLGPGKTVLVQYALPKRETTEEMPVSKRKFKLAWRGDEVVSADPPVPIYSGKTRQS